MECRSSTRQVQRTSAGADPTRSGEESGRWQKGRWEKMLQTLDRRPCGTGDTRFNMVK